MWRLTGRTYCAKTARTWRLADAAASRCSCAGTKAARTRLTGAHKMGWIFGIIYFVLLVTLGVLSLRKGHWIMFIVGLFIPLFWLIGALLPRRVARM
jgi:hypothetical protein